MPQPPNQIEEHDEGGLPEAYQWLEQEKFPRILLEALKLYGTKEKRGAAHNPIILGWAKEIKSYVGIPYDADEIPWCGLFIGVCASRAGYAPPKVCIRAKEWGSFGVHSNRPKLGDVLIFDRAGGGHVGLYVGEDSECFHVLGGNQGNAVSIVRIEKKRLLKARECPWRVARPPGLRAIILDSAGAISHNEK